MVRAHALVWRWPKIVHIITPKRDKYTICKLIPKMVNMDSAPSLEGFQ